MKRLFAILLVLTLVICCFAACGKDEEKENNGTDDGTVKETDPAYESQLEVEGGALELQTSVDGETLYASVVMTGNPGFAGFAMSLEFDNTKITAREITASDIIDYESITSNIHQGGDMAAYTSVTATWFNPSDVTGDGILYTVAFDIVDAEAEDFGFKIVCANDAFSNQNLEAVVFNVK